MPKITVPSNIKTPQITRKDFNALAGNSPRPIKSQKLPPQNAVKTDKNNYNIKRLVPQEIQEKEKEYAMEAFQHVRDYGYSLTGGRNGKADAFRHAYSAAKATLERGRLVSEAGGLVHELTNPPYSPKETAMDIHNNHVGANIANKLKKEGDVTNKEIADAINRAIESGQLKTLVDY